MSTLTLLNSFTEFGASLYRYLLFSLLVLDVLLIYLNAYLYKDLRERSSALMTFMESTVMRNHKSQESSDDINVDVHYENV